MDWATGASLATALGTLILAIATFASVRSANRSARVAERALLAGLRPLLVPTRLDDRTEKVGFADGHWIKAEGGQRMITRFGLLPHAETGVRMAVASRHWNIDRPDPR